MGNSIKELGDNFKYANKEYANSRELFGEGGYLNNLIRGEQKSLNDIDKMVPYSERSDEFLQDWINDLDEAELSGDDKALKRLYDEKLNDYQKYIEDYGNATQNEKRTIEGLRKYQNDYISSLERQNKEIAKSSIGSRISSGISSIGKSALALAGNIALMYAVSKGIELAATAWDNYSHRQEKAIEKGEQTLASHKHSLENYNDTAKTIDAVGERFEELRKGVSSTGENIGLTTSEFEEYQSIVSQISSSMPELIDGYDSLGNPIISATTNIEQLTSALKEQQRVIAQENIGNAKDYAEAFNAVMNQSPTDFTQESGLVQQKALLDEMISDINNGENIAEKFFGSGDIKTFAAGILKPINDILVEPGNALSGLFENISGAEIPDSLTGILNRVWQATPGGASNLKNMLSAAFEFTSSLSEGQGIIDSIGDAFQTFVKPASMMGDKVEKSVSDLLTLQDIAKEAGINEDVLDQIQSGKGIDSETEQYVRDKITAYSKQVESEMDTQLNNTKPLLESMLQGDDNGAYYDSLKDSTKSAISQIVNGMDIKDAMETGLIGTDGSLNTDGFKKWADGIAQNIQKSGVEDAISDFFSLKDKSADMGYKEYMDETNKLVDSISSKVPELSESLLKSTGGLDANLNDLKQKRTDLMNDGFSEGLLNELSNADMEILWDLNADGLISGAENAKNAIEDAKKAIESSNPDSYFTAWQEATKSENLGSKYDTMRSGYESAKDAYDKGLTGTDDFKTFAAMISPTGSDDPRNFAENYPKFQRYFQEGKQGIDNFLSDMSGLVDSSGKALAEFDSKSGKWKFNVSDVDKMAQNMGISSEMAYAAFNKMQEYGIGNNIISNSAEGGTRTGELISDLQAEKKRLDKLEADAGEGVTGYETDAGSHTFGNQTSIDEARAKIQQYNSDIQETTANTRALIEAENSSSDSKKNAAIAAAKAMNEQKKIAEEAGLSDTANIIQSEMDKLGADYGFDVDATVNFDLEKSEEAVQNLFDSAWNKQNSGGDITKNLDNISNRIHEIAEQGGDISSMVTQFNDLAEASGNAFRMDESGNKFNLLDKINETKALGEEISKIQSSGQDASTKMSQLAGNIQTLSSSGFNVSGLVSTYNQLAEASGSEYRMELTGEIVSVDEYTGEKPEVEVKAKITRDSLSNSIEEALGRIDQNSLKNDTPTTTDTLLNDSEMSGYIEQIHEMTNGNNKVALKFGLEGNETPEQIAAGLLNGTVKIPAELDFTGSNEKVKKAQKVTSDMLESGVQPHEGYTTPQKDFNKQQASHDMENRGAITGHTTSQQDFNKQQSVREMTNRGPLTGFTVDSENYAANMSNAANSAKQINANTSNIPIKKMGIGADDIANGFQKAADFAGEVGEKIGEAFTGEKVSGAALDEPLSDTTDKLSEIDGKTSTATVDVETNGEEEVKTVDESLEKTDGKTAKATVDVDASSAESSISGLETEETEIPVTVKMDEGQFGTLYEGLTGEPLPLEMQPTISGNTDPELTQLTNEAPIQKKVEVSTEGAGDKFLGELTAEDFQKTITVNEEKGTEVTTEEAEPVVQTVNQELGTEVTTEEPAPVTQEVQQQVTKPLDTDLPPAQQEVEMVPSNSATEGVDTSGGTVTYDVQFTPDTPPPMEGGSVNYEVNFNPDAPPEMSGGSVEYSVKFNPNSPPAMTGGSVSYAVTFDPSSPPPMDGGSVSYTGDFPTTAPAITGTVNYKGNFPTSAPTISGVVNYTGNFPTSAPSLQSTITYYAHVVGAPHSAGTVSNNSFNAMTSAHAGGTVNKTPKLKSSRFNDGYLGHAYVNPKDNGLKHDETALVNEVGGEAIVRDGKVMIMNNGYPSLTSLKSGDIIFNHKQTAELMKKGYISNSHGKLHGSLPARATGTVNTGIPAHAEGSKSKWEKSYDFIQRRIESLEFQYKAHQDSSELAESLTKKNKYLDKALKDNKKLIASNEKGDRYYYEKAMSVGLSKELRDKVRTGDIRMEDYDEGTKQQIEDYSKMLDLSRQCREAVRDLKKEQKELANQKLENVLDYYDSKLGVLKGQQGYEAAKQKLNVATGHGGNRMVKERLNRQLKNQNQQTKLYEQQMAKYKETLKTVGKSSGKNSKDYRDALAQYNELKEAWIESKVAAQEYKNEIRDINYQWKQNKVDKYERGSDRLAGVREYYDTAKNISASKRGGIVAQQIKNNSNQIIEKKALADSYRKEQATLHFNDERYQELADLIANLDTEIINLGTDTIKLQDDIREIRWEGFENGITDINNRLQEFSDIRSMISSDSMVNTEDGSLTDFGYANILLTADAMELNNQKIADYREAIEKLKEEEQNGVISKEKYNELVNQYQKEIRDAASANKDYKQSLIDMYETQINYENDALQDNITKRKNALKAKKEYYDYDKRIKKQNKDINSLEAQISSLQGATNAADIAKRLRLEEELADLMDEKDDDVRDHAYDLQIDGYDKLADAADESLKKTENALATSTQAQQQCVDNMLNKMTSSYSSAYGKVDEIVKSSGIAVSTSFQETIKNFDGLTEVGNITVDKFVQSINTKVIVGLNDLAQKIVNGTTSGNDTNAEASGDGLVHVQSVKLSKTSITIIEGESITLTAEVLPKNANVRTLDWSTNSDNIKISTPKGATNSLSKVITGVKTNGRGDACVVTVTTRDVVHKTATCKVRVTTKTASLLNQLKGKSNAGTSAVNKVLREFGYGQASQASMVQFASDLGVKDVTAKNVMNADKQKAIAEKLRARFEKDEKRAVVKSIIDSLPDENRSKEAISKLSQLNQYISSSTGKRLTQTGALQLAEAMRLVVPGDYDSWSTGDKNFVLDEFKKLGFAKGGKISSGHYLPSKLLNEVPGNNGDDGWITVQREEVVLTKNETRQLKMQSAIMSDILSNISNGYNGLENPSYDATQRNAIPTDIIRNAGNISFNYGNMIDLDIANVDKDVMPDLDRLLGKCIKQTKEELLKEFRKMGYR